MKTKLTFILMLIIFASFMSDKPAYKIYTAKGEASDYDKMLADVMNADIVLFGEQHNNPISHWLQLELTKDAFKAKKEKLVLGAEMYEADNQLLLNEYLNGKISEKSFKDEAKLWPNDPTDYKPLLDFAKTNHLSFVASNVPRRYAAAVNKKGFETLDSLDVEAKKFLAPLPIKYDPELKCYKDMMQMGGMGGSHANANLPKAQALKDATMAYFINKNFSKGNLFIHFNGAYHSDNFLSIGWYLKQINPNFKIVTISCVEQEDVSSLDKESQNLANYIICIPQTMTKTY
jgi:uncharacterized iron-regulated protein